MREPIKPCLGFRFSTIEEIMIARAKRHAQEYMQNYGKGQKPFMVDLSHYETTRTTKD